MALLGKEWTQVLCLTLTGGGNDLIEYGIRFDKKLKRNILMQIEV